MDPHQAFEPLAIVGMACRFPGGLHDLETLWRALQTRFSAISETPANRWSADRYYSPFEGAKGKAYVRRGGYIHQDYRQFDASFFGISPRDAENMDPQQRLMLEVCWEAFENAGLPLPEFAGTPVGVYVGGFMLDHMITQMAAANRSQINQNSAAGMMMTMLSNRISHVFDLRGPSLSIDTACSSSLVAFHYACQDLWSGRCPLAIVGGVNLMTRPEYPIGMSKGQFLARDGQCKSFDSRADGYGRAEGAGVVLLKPLSAAQAAGDPIWATVLGTGTNQDGHTPGISMPNGEAQAALIREVCQQYNIGMDTIDYVECHGTGTAIGDPTEARAIGSTYGQSRDRSRPVVIGSIKSNIGHMEAGAGVAGVIKAVLTLAHRQATPLASLITPNPNIPFADLNLKLSDDLISLGPATSPLRAAINSFGYGGSNAHAILESAPCRADMPPSNDVSPSSDNTQLPEESEHSWFLPITARSESAVRALAREYAAMIRAAGSPHDLIASVIKHRATLDFRAVAWGRTIAQLLAQLDALAEATTNGEAVPEIKQIPFQGHDKPVFVFTGMGPQWWGMGQQLYREHPVYRAAVDQADTLFQEIAGFSILAEMLKGEAESQITKTEFAQPANFLIQIGLLAILKHQGIEPGACVGHSVGELASAFAAGTLSLRDALTVCFHRSRLQALARGTGAMLAVGISQPEAQRLIDTTAGRVSIAAINGRTNLTLAGDRDEIARLAEQLTAAGTFNRQLEVEVPYHSPAMDPLMGPLAQALASVQPSPPQVPLYSTVTGKRVWEASYGADYWPQNIRQPVEFLAAIHAVLQDGYTLFIEVGPHPVLATSIKECFKSSERDCRHVLTLRRNTDESQAVHRAAAEIFVNGGQVRWPASHHRGQRVELPNYPWQREYHWLENPRAEQDRINPIVHPILGTQEAPGTPAWRNDFDHHSVNYLRDHQVLGLPIMPAAGYIEAALELAAVQFPEALGHAVRHFQIQAPLILKADKGLDFVTSLDTQTGALTIRSLENGKLGLGQIHATAEIGPLTGDLEPTDLAGLAKTCDGDELPIPLFYEQLQRIGLQYGPAFQAVTHLQCDAQRTRVLSRLTLPTDLQDSSGLYRLHPSLLDGCFQTLMGMIDLDQATYLPASIDEVRMYQLQAPAELFCLAQVTQRNDRFVDCDLTLFSPEGQVVAEVRRLRALATKRRERVDQWGETVKLQIINYIWNPGEALAEPSRLGQWLVVSDQGVVAEQLSDRITNYGATISAFVRLGTHFTRDGEQYTVRGEQASDWLEVLSAVDELDGVLFAHTLDAKPQSHDPTGELALRTLVVALQQLLNDPNKRLPRVYTLTQAAFQIVPSDRLVNPTQSTFNGFAHVAFNELDGNDFTTIDLPNVVRENSMEAIVQELICNAREDEVAVRDGVRFASELALSDAVTGDRTAVGFTNDLYPIQLRPVKSDADVGTVRIQAIARPELASNQVRIRIERSSVPVEFITGDPESLLELPLIEFVGEVIEVGASTSQLQRGDLICGLAAADAANQWVINESDLVFAALQSTDDVTALLSQVTLLARAAAVWSDEDQPAAGAVVIQADSLGLLLAEKLRQQGHRPLLVAFDEQQRAAAEQAGWDCLPPIASRLERCLETEHQTRSIALLIANLSQWKMRMGWQLVVPGALAIDTNPQADDLVPANHFGELRRSSLSLLIKRPQTMRRAWQTAIADFRANPGQYSATNFEVALADVAWQRLPIKAELGSLIIKYETENLDLPIIQRDALSLAADATFLITGGFGGFGQQTARWLVDRGCRHLVLLGRKGADTSEKQQFVEELVQRGVKVLAVAGDAANRDQLRQILHEAAEKLPPLKGIVHSAAAILDQPILEIDLETLSTVMRNKAMGAWILHEETRHLPLEYFILYSSAANLVGNSRQSIYSAANGYLNGLAHFRVSQGLPATSINWGAIADVGIVARDAKLEQFLRYVGLRGMASTEALSLLEKGLVRNLTQFGATIIKSWGEWGRFEVRAAKSARYQKLIAADSQQGNSDARQALVAELSPLTPDEQLELLLALMTELIAGVLKIEPQQLAPNRPISELGVDSLMATEIQMILETKLGLKIAVLELIGDVTLMSLAKNCLANLGLNAVVSTTV